MATAKRAALEADGPDHSKRMKLGTDSESDDSTSVLESIRSLQAYETATPRDTSDTSNSGVEFDVQSQSDITLSEVSSGPEDWIDRRGQRTFLDEFATDLYVADLSDSLQVSDQEDQMHVESWCTKCQGSCDYPFRLCLKCFRQKKIYLPPRPKRKRKRNQFPHEGAGSFESRCSQEFLGSKVGSSVSEGSQSQEAKPSLCKCCFANPVDGVFIHKNSVHSIYCYQCSVKQWRLRGRCAYCQQKLCRVAKLFPVNNE